MNKTLLKISGLQVAYGGIRAVKGVSLEVQERELVCLIGSNGAGKSTTLKTITGLLKPASGTIEYLGQTTEGQGAWNLVRMGLVMVPEGRAIFSRMSIIENLMMGAFVRHDPQVSHDLEQVFHT
ncbi:MAG: ATP-binding cassette domain-containing protein, partial [Burkholderiales bacterium]